MNDGGSFFTQFDISAGTPMSGRPTSTGDLAETNGLLRELVEQGSKQNNLLLEILTQVSLQHRQRAAELKAWKEANPQLAKSCRRAAESLARVHTEFLSSIAQEAADNAEDFSAFRWVDCGRGKNFSRLDEAQFPRWTNRLGSHD